MSRTSSAGKLFGAIVAGWLGWRLFGPEVPRRYQPPQVRPLRVPGRSVFVGEREFFVREVGSPAAQPLVLIHGWSLDAEMTYHRIVPELATRYRVVMPDLRNHGKSARRGAVGPMHSEARQVVSACIRLAGKRQA